MVIKKCMADALLGLGPKLSALTGDQMLDVIDMIMHQSDEIGLQRLG